MNLQVELSCPKEMAWKVNMHRGYLAICHPEEQQLNFIERLVEMASSLAIREWRRLPHIVSHVHTPLLQVSAQNAWRPFPVEMLQLDWPGSQEAGMRSQGKSVYCDKHLKRSISTQEIISSPETLLS